MGIPLTLCFAASDQATPKTEPRSEAQRTASAALLNGAVSDENNQTDRPVPERLH
jgi:hypothetical protein